MSKLIIFVVVLGGAALAAAWYAGVLSPVSFEEKPAGPFFVVYEDHEGPYALIKGKIEDVQKTLDTAQIKYNQSFAQYFDDPKKVPAMQLRSIGGVLVDGPVDVESPLAFQTITYNNYLVASFTGLPQIGPSVVYPKAIKWMQTNNKTLNGPIIEIYDKAGLKMAILYMFPIK